MVTRILAAAPLFFVASCAIDLEGPPKPPVLSPEAPAGPEAVSLLGDELFPTPLTDQRRAELEANFDHAWEDYTAAPQNEEAVIWAGRRLAYLGRYRDAVEVFTHGLEVHPASYKLLRHRGHRWVTLRRFDRAVTDLARAAELARGVPDEVEPDGAPNRFGIPTSTNQSNIYYHLGLANYLQGRFEEALAAYETCMGFSSTDDMRVATAYWTYMTCMRLGRADRAAEVLAPIHADLEILENTAYHALLLHYKGELTEEDVLRGIEPGTVQHSTRGYGLANRRLWEGDAEGARTRLETVLAGGFWPAFGHLAAEADLARLR
ncbi:MAG: tetratricopeptide repeat protein [Planctomycetota bacterium]